MDIVTTPIATQPNGAPATPPLLTLPSEILTLVLAHLPSPTTYHTLLSLRLTHPIFATLITPTHLTIQHILLSDHYLFSESDLMFSPTPVVSNPNASVIDTLWPCYICLHSFPGSNFSHAQTHGRHSLGHAKAQLRCCLACGVRKGIYTPGTILRCFHGPDQVVCLSCKALGQAAKEGVHFSMRSHSGGETSSRDLNQHDDPTSPPISKSTRSSTSSKNFKGHCVSCVRRAHSQALITKLQDMKAYKATATDPSKKIQTEIPQSPRLHNGKGTSERKGRCQRCWAIDHTERPAMKIQGGQLLCQTCWVQCWI